MRPLPGIAAALGSGPAIAIVGMACRYPDADNVTQLYENALAQRQAFRVLPAGRLGAAYFDTAGQDADRAYARHAAVIKNFVFDRAAFRVSQRSFASTDMTHWLALTVASEAIRHITWSGEQGAVAGHDVRVIVGNTLTGEFSRAHQLRLRWPYVRAVIGAELDAAARDDDRATSLLAAIEQRYKSAFPVPDEDFLAGGLSNTIAGRICNHFDFRGGGYGIDGACSSSLLAVADGCSALAAGDAAMVLAGGVDLSLDPFELVGFSRTAALSRTTMRVYDERSDGFWPGEGCGFVALMRHEDALAAGVRVHAVIKGWGVSSDGSGGLTRPEAAGQALAMARCYRRAGIDAASIGYFEGHGTGTRVGDGVELEALVTARMASGASLTPAVVSSVKANIGHTKAAAGLAGLLRAAMCVREGVLPPATACQRPHALLREQAGGLRAAPAPEHWPQEAGPRRASVSAMGFGGINAHLTLEQADRLPAAAPSLTPWTVHQDAELFLFAAASRADLAWTITHVAALAPACSLAELTDLAAELARRATRGALVHWRAAIVAATPDLLHDRLVLLGRALEGCDGGLLLQPDEGWFLAGNHGAGKVGLVFSGQGSPARATPGLQGRRFDAIGAVYRDARLGDITARDDTDFAQPAIVTASLGGLALLRQLGVTAAVAVGHSLGELSALHWAGHIDAARLQALARERGQVMVAHAESAGAMAAVSADAARLAPLVADMGGVHVANVNAPGQTVLAGAAAAIEAAAITLRARDIGVTMLPVRRAFHTPLMDGVARALAARWRDVPCSAAHGRVVSTLTGAPLPATLDLARHLSEQVRAPVQYLRAVRTAAAEVDLLLEVGPGALLARLTRTACATPVLALDIGGDSLAPLLTAAGACFVLGQAPAIGRLFAGRFARPFDWSWKPRFFANPCETTPDDRPPPPSAAAARTVQPEAPIAEGDLREQLRHFLADRTGLPAWSIQDSSRMLSDLHLNSITVGEIMAQMAAALRLPALADPTAFANASVRDIVSALEQRVAAGSVAPAGNMPVACAAPWIGTFAFRLHPAPPLAPPAAQPSGTWTAHGHVPAQAAALLHRLARDCGSGAIVWLGAAPGPDIVPGLLAAAHDCIARDGAAATGPVHFVVVQHGWGGAGFARSFALENPRIDTLVLNLPPALADGGSAAILRDVAAGASGFREIVVDADDVRHAPWLEPVRPGQSGVLPVGAGDVVLVTGGGKGIGAACAHALARRSQCALLIVGRDAPQASAELRDHLARLEREGIVASYQQADVADAAAMAAALARGVAALGAPVSALVHCAGTNRPSIVAQLTVADVAATLAPKVTGLRNVLAALEGGSLKMLMAFGSIIARMGLAGESDYALANEWLGQEVKAYGAQHPMCRALAIDWSVWAGTGMGQRLGRMDALVAQDIVPIQVDDGVACFLRLLASAQSLPALIAASRFGAPATVACARVQPGRWRFIERVVVSYPGHELVAECSLTPERDPYLDDHVLHGERLLPAVMALEAMAEVACALGGEDPAAWAGMALHDIAFHQALVVPKDGPCVLRIAAVLVADGATKLSICSSSTQYQLVHVEATRAPVAEPAGGAVTAVAPPDSVNVLDPGDALYRNGLFQSGRFQRIGCYDLVEARRCGAWLTAGHGSTWFAPPLPDALLLGDPGARDAALHAVQACIPHQIVVPTAVGVLHCAPLGSRSVHRMLATEVADHGAELVYDLTIFDEDGKVIEHWHRLTLRVVGPNRQFRLTALPLTGTFFERQMAIAAPNARLTVRLARDERFAAPGSPAAAGRNASRSYSAGWRVEIAGAGRLGCDLQEVKSTLCSKTAPMLGAQDAALADHIAATFGEAADAAATRVWAMREAMKKAGLAHDCRLTVDAAATREWMTATGGDAKIYCVLTEAGQEARALCLALALRPALCETSAVPVAAATSSCK